MVANTDISHCAKPAPQSPSPSLLHSISIAITPSSTVAATSIIDYGNSNNIRDDGVGCGGGDGGGGCSSGGSRSVVKVVVMAGFMNGECVVTAFGIS